MTKGVLPVAVLAVSVVLCRTLPASGADATAGPVDDATAPWGVLWDPDRDPASGKVFASFDFESVPPHSRPAFETLRPSDRPPGFTGFFYVWLAVLPLMAIAAVFSVVVERRRRIVRGSSPPGLPDDFKAMAAAIAVGLSVRLVGAMWLWLHGSEWGSVEHKPLSALGDIVFNGYEVLTNPPLLNLVEHFVFMVSDSPFWFRMPVVLAGVWMIWSSRCAARELFGSRAGVAAAFLVALNPGLVIWSATMRAYLPMMAFIVAAIAPAVRLSTGRGSNRDAVLLGLFGALAVWTHYIAWIWLGILAVAMFAVMLRKPGRMLRPVLSALMVLVAFLPLFPFFFDTFADKQGSMLPESWGVHMLAIGTGMPGPAGVLVVIGLVAARFWRSLPAIILTAVVAGYVALCVATSGIIFWEVSYSVGLSAVVMILMAGVLERTRLFAAGMVVMFTLMASVFVLVAAEPSRSPVVSSLTRPFLWRSVSVERFADRIADFDGPHVVLVTPAFESEPFLYHLGPVTPAEAGVEPVVVRNFDEMRVSGERGSFQLIGFERYWSWRLGQWPELSRYLKRFGSFWYARMQSSCSTSEGMTWSEHDCAWMAANCRLVESMAVDELYLCRSSESPVQSDHNQEK